MPEIHYTNEPDLSNFNDYLKKPNAGFKGTHEGIYTKRSLESFYAIERKCDNLTIDFNIKKKW
jgi:hypothetical protein